MNIIKGELKSKNRISNEEFEELFGNIPFQNIDKIKKYINKNYISKDKIRAKIKEIDEDELLQKIDFGQIALAIKVLYELLEE